MCGVCGGVGECGVCVGWLWEMWVCVRGVSVCVWVWYGVGVGVGALSHMPPQHIVPAAGGTPLGYLCPMADRVLWWCLTLSESRELHVAAGSGARPAQLYHAGLPAAHV